MAKSRSRPQGTWTKLPELNEQATLQVVHEIEVFCAAIGQMIQKKYPKTKA